MDKLPFTTVAQQAKVTTDNSYVQEEYINRTTGAREMCYGRIHSIIEHELYPGCPDELRHVLLECDWYTPTGVTTASGLLQVSYDEENSRTNRWTFLKDMYRANVILWPTYTHAPQFEVKPRTFVVVQHVAVFLDSQKDDDEDDDEDDDM